MIESLTEEQKNLLSVYRDKWMKIGLSTEPADHAKAEEAIRRAYEAALLTPPSRIVWTTSPLAGSILISILKNDSIMKKVYAALQKDLKIKIKKEKIGDSVRNSVRDSVRDSVWDSVRDSVWNSVWDSVRDSFWNSVWDSVRDSVWNSVWDSVRDSVGDSVGDSVRNSVRYSVGDSVGYSVWDSVGDSVRDSVRYSVWDSVWDSVGDSVGDSCAGQHSAAWLGFYEYFLEVLKVKACEKLIPLMDLATCCNWFFPYKNIVILSEKPTDCRLKNGRIHREDGPAIRYPDDFSVWALNGVRVPKELVETPAENLNADLILKEKNAEIRREIVRKIGVQRICTDLKSECIDQMDSYRLLILDLKDGRKRPYLEMKNPSIEATHIEGVHPDCKSVRDALAWRNSTSEYKAPKVLT